MWKRYFLGLLAAFILNIGPVVAYASDDYDSDDYDDEYEDIITIHLSDPTGGLASGKVIIENEPEGVDTFKLKAKGLKPNARYSVFLTESPLPGALPAQFLGEFKANKKGKGKFKAVTEIINAFASANVAAQDDSGISGMGSGALAKGANTIPLDFIRVYIIPPNNKGGNVFGGSEDEPGGKPLVLTSGNDDSLMTKK